MNKLTIAITFVAITTTSISAFATGTKGGDPRGYVYKSTMFESRTGTKGGDPLFAQRTGTKGGDPINQEDTGIKGGDPTSSDSTGTKGGDPDSRVIAKDSGYPTLMALLSKYFSF